MFGDNVVKQSSFSRVLANEAKAGAYYTDKGQCESVAGFFVFPDEEEVCCLEPSIGDASAVKTVVQNRENVRIFGVELQKATAEKTKADVEALLNADFLTDVRISNGVFSFCFANPPYGTDQLSKERYEKIFLEKIFSYLAVGARLVYVIPEYVFSDDKFYKTLLSRFEINHIFRFREPVFSQFQQCVCIATKKAKLGYTVEEADAYVKRLDVMEELPEKYVGEKLTVAPSPKSDVKIFTRTRFDAEAALEVMKHTPLTERVGTLFSKEAYKGNEIRSPIIPLSNDMYYLLAISGAGQGIAGSEKNRDIHLQRGCVKRVKSQSTDTDEKGNSRIIEREYSSVTMTIIEQSGKITKLQ